MNSDPLIGRRLFVDGTTRPVFRDDGGHQYVIDRDGDDRRQLVTGGVSRPEARRPTPEGGRRGWTWP